MIIKPTPQDTSTRAGLSAIRRRIGTHATFKAAMLRGLRSHHRPGLAGLLTATDEDWTIAFLDSCAGVLDTLAFYNERLVNEAYLGTATEAFSLQELAALVGAVPTPALAAEAWLAFGADPGVLERGVVELPPGIAVKSIPEEGELPQTFETVEPLCLKAAWNNMAPVTVWPQSVQDASDGFYIDPARVTLRSGDVVALLDDAGALRGGGGGASVLRPVTRTLRVADKLVWVGTGPDTSQIPLPTRADLERPVAAAGARLQPSDLAALLADLSRLQWSRAQVLDGCTGLGLDPDDLARTLAVLPRVAGRLTPVVFREKCRFFGHDYITRPSVKPGAEDAILYDLPASQQPSRLDAQSAALVNADMRAADAPTGSGATRMMTVYLDRKHDRLVAGSLIALRGRREVLLTGGRRGVTAPVVCWCVIDSVETASIEAYGLSAEVTKLRVPARWSGGTVDDMMLRSAELFFAAEPVPLTDVPLAEPVEGASILLDRPDFDIAPGQGLFVTGTRADLPGVVTSERVTVAGVWSNGTTVRVTFTVPLAQRYLRDTVLIEGNVARATHGETKTEILGSGDATIPFQRFRLRSGPLTYTSAATPSGRTAALEVRVDGVRWCHVAALDQAGPTDRVYTVTTRVDGQTEVMFGGGDMGAALPTGDNNVMVIYRIGAGATGRLKARQLSLLVAKPRSLRAVSNPLATTGGADFAGIEEIRAQAPMGMTTLGRIVSFDDYQAFALTFAGIGKARASWSWVGEDQHVFLTVTGEDAAPMESTGAVLSGLARAVAAQSAPGTGVTVRPARVARFTLAARLVIDPDWRATGGSADPVLAQARLVLRQTYAFDARGIGDAVRASDVMTLLQGVPGVLAVDLDALHRTDRAVALEPILRADVPRSGGQGVMLGSEILVLSDDPVTLEAT